MQATGAATASPTPLPLPVPAPHPLLPPRCLPQVEKSGAQVRVTVNTAQQRASSEVQSVMDGVSNGTLAADLTMAGRQSGWWARARRSVPTGGRVMLHPCYALPQILALNPCLHPPCYCCRRTGGQCDLGCSTPGHLPPDHKLLLVWQQ